MPDEGRGAALRRFLSSPARRVAAGVAAGVAAIGAAFLVSLAADDIAGVQRTIEAERVASVGTAAKPGTEQYEKDTRTGRYDSQHVRALFESCRDQVRRKLAPAVVVRFDEGDNYPYVRTFRGTRSVFFAANPVSDEGLQLLDVPIEGEYEVVGGVVSQPLAGAPRDYLQYRCAVVALGVGFVVKGVSVAPHS